MGKEVEVYNDFDPGTLLMPLLMLVMVTAMAGMVTSITPLQQYVQSQAYTGLTDDRTLRATPIMQWLNLIDDPPYHPWITAYFFNDGPSSVLIGINNPDELTELASGEDKTVDMTGADRRIELVFYKCSVGTTASIRAIGKY